MMSGLLPDSMYAWACGEKASGQEKDLKTSDQLIGWLILLVRRVQCMLLYAPDSSWFRRYSQEEENLRVFQV